MIKQFFFIFCLTLSIGVAAQSNSKKVSYVNPFLGTSSVDARSLSGSTFPGATMPFGLVQLSPDTDNEINLPPAGYNYNSKTIVGFSHTHLSGTGIADLFDVLMMPTTGEIKTDPGTEARPDSGYRSRFSHANETARPGYYSVRLDSYGVKAELTATVHAGFHCYTFPQSKAAHILIDLEHTRRKTGLGIRNAKIITAQIRIVDNKTIEGYRVLSGWAKLRKVYFHAEFSKPFTSTLMIEGKNQYPGAKLSSGASNIKAVVNFDTREGEQVLVKVGLSAVSEANAAANLHGEIPAWNFDKAAQQAEAAWERELAKIDIEGTDEQKKIFYSCMYHAFIQPNTITDNNGDYPAGDMTMQHAGKSTVYSTFSLWDTYRAAHPLYTLLQTQKTADFVASMVRHYKSYGFLPIWELWGSETYCMIGNHAIPVIADAILKGIKGIDVAAAYEAIKGSSLTDHVQSPVTLWEKYGYMPEDLQSQSVSVTLETAYDDWCVAQVAKKLNKTEDYQRFLQRSGYFANLFDANTGFFRAKLSNGKWQEPFDPLAYGGNGGQPFTEGNAWQYLWYVPQDVPRFIQLMGGDKKFSDKLNVFFTLKDTSSRVNANASGFIGQYAHGNEPSHHAAYLYNYAGLASKTQFYVSKILNELYQNSPAGYAGNDDCGQMSAWYIFSAMGFYPVNPANGRYDIGSPILSKAVIHLDGGKQFTVTATNVSKANCYVQSIKLNGQPYHKAYITHTDLLAGGMLEFVMGASPNPPGRGSGR